MELVYTTEDGTVQKHLLYDFKGPGVALGMYNTDESIQAFAHSSFQVILWNTLLLEQSSELRSGGAHSIILT